MNKLNVSIKESVYMSVVADTRRKDLDVLKAFAIIAVILYHFDFSIYGYLGVDLFFVVNGFLITKSLIQLINKGSFSYSDFILKRFCRLYPLVIISGVVSLLVGALSMLPDNYENVSMSVISSNLFLNNVLSAITTKNYWDVVNNYKPLMHTWYLGIVAAFYLIYPLFFIVPMKLLKNKSVSEVLKRILVLITVCTIVSLVLYFIPSIPHASKFYYLPFRFYELSFGAIIAFVYKTTESKTFFKIINRVSVVLILLLMFINTKFINDSLRLISVVVLSSLALYTYSTPKGRKNIYDFLPFISNIGMKSYSYFIWHQLILAFWRCYIGSEFTLVHTIVCGLIIILVSEVSYYFIENKIKPGKKTLAICVACAAVVCVVSGIIYLRAGVIRDVPELGISADKTERQMHASYCDRIYGYNNGFSQNNKIKVSVIGNSFARDFANILLESSYADKIEISYTTDYAEEYNQRFLESDYIFLYSQDETVYVQLSQVVDKEKIWVIGTKNFGECNDMIYLRRNRDDYFDTTIKPSEDSLLLNQKMKNLYKDHYIDLMAPIMNDSNEVSVFTNDNKFISQDCRHLTQYGAMFYAEVLNLEAIFSKLH